MVSANPGIHIVVGVRNRGPTQAKVGSIVIRQYTAQSEFIVQGEVIVVANRGENATVFARPQEVIDKGKSLYAIRVRLPLALQTQLKVRSQHHGQVGVRLCQPSTSRNLSEEA